MKEQPNPVSASVEDEEVFCENCGCSVHRKAQRQKPSASVEEIVRVTTDDIFGMFGGILNRIVDRIESGLTDGIAEECGSVKLDDVKDPILKAINAALAPVQSELEQAKGSIKRRDEDLNKYCDSLADAIVAKEQAETELEQMRQMEDRCCAIIEALKFTEPEGSLDSRISSICTAFDDLRARLATAEAALEQAQADVKRLDWLEKQTKASRTGISFDYCKYVEDGQVIEKGFRFMRYHWLADRADSIRKAIDRAMSNP